MFKKIISLFIFSTFLFTSINASVFFVATTGNDANDGSMSKPFATIQKAQDAVKDFYDKNKTILSCFFHI